MNYLKKRKLKFLYYSHFSTQRHHIIMFRIRNLPRTILQLSIVIVFCYSRCGICLETDTINSAVVLRDDDTIRSIGHQFTLGFFSPNGTTRRYMGIWFNVSLASVAWVANRENPLNDSSGTISISSNGNLVLTNGNRDIMWSTNVTTSSSNTNTTAQLLDSGNLVLRDSSSGDIIWESHRHPDNTFLPTMRISHNLRTGERVGHNTWRTFQDPGHGNFTSGLNATGVPQLYIWENGSPLWRSGPWNGRSFTGITGMYSFYVDGFSLGIEEDGTYYFMRNLRQGTTTRNFLSTDGILSEESWAAEENTWTVRWRAPDNNCDRYNNCGPFSVCYSEDSPICSCLRGYEPRNRGEWNRGEWSGGCVRRTRLQCERDSNATDRNREDGFSRLTQIKVPDFLRWSSGVESECRGLCLRNCSCLAYAFESGIGCMFWNGTLNDVQKFQVNAGSDFYIRVAYSELGEENNNNVVITASTIASFFAASICLFLAWWTCKRKGQNISRCDKGETASPNSIEIVLRCDIDKVNIEELPMYSLEVLASATNNFNGGNKLGTGGFGPVYKGKLANGREIAVKRLSAASEQGSEEFMNEVVVISKLQHRNLVRLLGCCVENEEKMLIYEYLQNKSLDVFLFEKTQDIVDWRKRFNIIEGIGRGLLYLHRDSRLRIIHRDLKPSNILLDEFWNPKISDFGMARIFGGNQDQANTRKVVGTYGYMAPEYAIGGRFSEKSDVFSFGVLVLEIISGRKNTSFYNDEFSLGLLGYAWKLWNEDNVAYMIDERISNPVFSEEITRCIHIGLLCVQESPRNRPAISTVLSMLSSDIVELPVAEHPGYTERWIHSHDGSPSTDQTSSGNDITHTVLEGR